MDLIALEKGMKFQANNAKSKGVSLAWNKFGGPKEAFNVAKLVAGWMMPSADAH